MSLSRDDLVAALGTRVLLLDGGLGTELIARGLAQGEAPERWNLEQPRHLVEVHRAYVEAGSDIIHANTFGGTPIKLRQAGLEAQHDAINRRAIELAREAVDGRAWVAGDVGPTGALFPPMGDATEEALAAAFTAQAEVLAAAGADLISIETMFDLREALVAVTAAKETGLPVVASMTFEQKKRGAFTMVGDPLLASLQALVAAGADAVGLNCSVTAPQMAPMVQAAVAAVTVPVAAQPNAGQPRVTPDGLVYDAEPEAVARELVTMADLGARLLGGCCGTTPVFIRALRAALGERDAA